MIKLLEDSPVSLSSEISSSDRTKSAVRLRFSIEILKMDVTLRSGTIVVVIVKI